MFTYEFLQNYWWFIVALLGGLLVFLLFVQGANAMILLMGADEREKQLMVNSTGRKWEFTFTTLVTFGGAFFASFPLFYSTSFGGAYWVWVLILVTFVLQAVSYEFQNRTGNIIGRTAFRVFLALNGFLAPLLIGTAVGTFFTGSDFTVNKAAAGDSLMPVISSWGNGWHGLEAVANLWNVSFGLMVVGLAVCLGLMYMINNIDDEALVQKMRRRLVVSGVVFLVFFLNTAAGLLTMDGFAVAEDGTVYMERYKYLHNFLQMPAVLAVFLAGTVLVLWGLAGTVACRNFRRGIWPAGAGTVLVVMAVLMVAGYNGTAYYPSTADLQSSLTIANSCSSEFTLRTMAYVSFVIPFVLAYIVFAWRAMDRRPLTSEELENTEHKY
ncbi:MAG: cytochrome d ubiquinol oxidase subunit II [Bacteroidales bacterium]|nr:cytochrome d ubiquinol oxidase subunit II [Bacteroidales bacterium]